MARAVFTEVPPKILSALEQHSDELLDLRGDFKRLDIYYKHKLKITSFTEGMTTVGLGEKVS